MAFLLEEIKQNKKIFFYKGVDDTVHEKQKKLGVQAKRPKIEPNEIFQRPYMCDVSSKVCSSEKK